MTYKLKHHGCPYMTSDRKCVHRYRKQKVTKRKRRCGYGDANDCEMYCEWDKLRRC